MGIFPAVVASSFSLHVRCSCPTKFYSRAIVANYLLRLIGRQEKNFRGICGNFISWLFVKFRASESCPINHLIGDPLIERTYVSGVSWIPQLGTKLDEELSSKFLDFIAKVLSGSFRVPWEGPWWWDDG